jgi:hypothetical protein
MTDKTSGLSTLASNIKQGVESRLKDLHTSMPGIIESFDADTQLASIQPAIRRIFITRDGDTEILTPSDLPILINVPVIFPRGGGFSLTFPVKKGDECLLNFCERSIDNWHETGKVKKPGARRFHSLSDATAFVGLSSLPNKIPNYDATNTEIKKDDGTVSIKLKENSDLDIIAEGNMNATITKDVNISCTNIKVDATSTAEVNCPESTFNGNLTVNGNISFTGEIDGPTAKIPTVLSTSIASSVSLSVGGKEMSGHIHEGSPTAPDGPISNTGEPI